MVDFECQTYTDTKIVAGASATGHNYQCTDNGDSTHTAVCVNGDDSFTEEHNFENGICVCGAKDESEQPSESENESESSAEKLNSPGFNLWDWIFSWWN